MKNKSGFDAMGKPVPENRLCNAYKAIKEMLPNEDYHTRYSIVSKCAHIIRRDEPFRIVGAVTALDKDLNKLDLTGRYRLLATLLTD